MPRLIWSQEALHDIDRLHRFLKNKNPDSAKRAITAIRQGVRLLSAHPEAGRPVPHMTTGFREWVIEFGKGHYIALYHYDRELIILAVRHDREDGYSLESSQ